MNYDESISNLVHRWMNHKRVEHNRRAVNYKIDKFSIDEKYSILRALKKIDKDALKQHYLLQCNSFEYYRPIKDMDIFFQELTMDFNNMILPPIYIGKHWRFTNREASDEINIIQLINNLKPKVNHIT